MRRDGWKFRISGNTLHKAAQQKITYHAERQAHWQAEQGIVTRQIEESAVTTVEHHHTGGKTVDVVVDVTLTKRLNECANKIDRHYASAEEFSRWEHALSFDRAAQLELDIEDMQFFGLKKEAP